MICEPLDLNRDLGKGLDLKLIACLIIEKLDLAGPQWTIKIQDHNPINYVKVSNLRMTLSSLQKTYVAQISFTTRNLKG